jgi:hypothetical protein
MPASGSGMSTLRLGYRVFLILTLPGSLIGPLGSFLQLWVLAFLLGWFLG